MAKESIAYLIGVVLGFIVGFIIGMLFIKNDLHKK